MRLVHLELIFVVLKTQFDTKLSLNSISVELQSDAAEKKAERHSGRRACWNGKDDVDENRARPRRSGDRPNHQRVESAAIMREKGTRRDVLVYADWKGRGGPRRLGVLHSEQS